MRSELQNHLSEHFPFLTGKKLLLAVSGGIDSMVLVHLFQKMDFEIALAHCNFQLRKEESLGDEQFLRDYSDAENIQAFFTSFNTEAFAEDYKISIQVAARELRYKWFHELLETEHLDYVITAHHADDNLETFLIHLTRGTGLDGLTGIPQQNGKIIRPLLDFSRVQIEEYAAKNHIQWREDSSNSSDKYLRNKLRHNVIPVLKELNPSLLQSFKNTTNYLQQANSMADDASRIVYRKVVEEDENQKKINIAELLVLPNYKAYLYQWLRPFGFNGWDDVYDLVESQSGKQLYSEHFRLLKDRDYLILSPKGDSATADEYFIPENVTEVNFPLRLAFSKVTNISNASNKSIFVDAKKLSFPLVLRKWKKGDSFQPFGMEGKSKKVSKLFKDEKLSLIAKENTWLLCSEKQIVWIVGIRQDERFKIENTTTDIVQIALL